MTVQEALVGKKNEKKSVKERVFRRFHTFIEEFFVNSTNAYFGLNLTKTVFLIHLFCA